MLSEANHKLNHLATHDTLTELPNRRFFEKEMIREIVITSYSIHYTKLYDSHVSKFIFKGPDYYGMVCGNHIIITVF